MQSPASPSRPLVGRTALVTGGGRGIGRAIAVALAARGARVVVTGRSTGDLEQVASATGGIAMTADLADRASIEALLARIGAEVGAVDVLVHNAGIATSAPLARTSDEDYDRTMEVNVRSAFVLARALLPGMVERRWGRFVAVASNAGRVGYPYTSAYCASKHALVGLVRALAAELGPSGVTANAVCPGWVRTDMAHDAVARIAAKTKRSADEAEATLAAMSPQRRLMEAEEVAHLVASLVDDGARGINGQAIPLDGGQVMA
jgi:NAD(P)-dependent dehydrogenase (short-subunit alcohol dehydrogenase family)